MKNLKYLILIALTIATLPALAKVKQKPASQPMVCSNAHGPSGYIFTFKPGGKVATLMQNSGNAVVPVATLKCTTVHTKPIGNDMMNTIQECEGKDEDGNRWNVDISAGGLWFHTDADIEKNGKEVASNVLCKPLN